MSEFMDADVLQLDSTCTRTGFQGATVCVPVNVTPFARSLGTTTRCCGNPVIVPGAHTCSGTKNGSCMFTISQRICVSVPVEFGANAVAGPDFFVTCEGASDRQCANCNSGGDDDDDGGDDDNGDQNQQ